VVCGWSAGPGSVLPRRDERACLPIFYLGYPLGNLPQLLTFYMVKIDRSDGF